MLRKLSACLFILFICPQLRGQINPYQNLLNSAFAGGGPIFVHATPIQSIELNSKWMREYLYNCRHTEKKFILDTVMFRQIINNSKSVDTTLWQDNELPGFLLVSDRNEIVSKKYAVQKFSPTDRKRMRIYKRRIKEFNLIDSFHRNISYFSRPVFDDTGTYAIIQRDNGNSFLSGGGEIILYHLQDNVWKEAVMIMNWAY